MTNLSYLPHIILASAGVTVLKQTKQKRDDEMVEQSKFHCVTQPSLLIVFGVMMMQSLN